MAVAAEHTLVVLVGHDEQQVGVFHSAPSSPSCLKARSCALDRYALYLRVIRSETDAPWSISFLRLLSPASILRAASRTAAACSRGTKHTPASSAQTRSPAFT